MFIIGHRRFGKALGLKEKRSANNALFTTINFIEEKKTWDHVKPRKSYIKFHLA